MKRFLLILLVWVSELIGINAVAASNEVIIDVRTPEEYSEAHYPNAINIEYQNIRSEISKLVPNKDTPIVLYCRTGRRAEIALKNLLNEGYANVINAGSLSDMKNR